MSKFVPVKLTDEEFWSALCEELRDRNRKAFERVGKEIAVLRQTVFQLRKQQATDGR